MKKEFSDKIIVLRCLKYSDSDLIVHGFSPVFGRLSFVAKGAMRSKKRFGGGVLEPTHYLEVQFQASHHEPSDQLCFLKEARLIEGFVALRSDYDKLQLAFYMIKQVDRLANPGVADPSALFDLLGNSLRTLCVAENTEKLGALFDLKLINSQGILPQDWDESRWLRYSIKDFNEFDLPMDSINRLRHKYQVTMDEYLGSQSKA